MDIWWSKSNVYIDTWTSEVKASLFSPRIIYLIHPQTWNISLKSLAMSKASRPFSSKYLNVSSYHFARLMLNATSSNRGTVRHWFRNVKVVHFFRQYARLFDKVTHFQLEQDYWNCVAETLSDTIVWLSKMPKVLTRQTSINWGVSENWEEYQKATKNHFKSI